MLDFVLCKILDGNRTVNLHRAFTVHLRKLNLRSRFLIRPSTLEAMNRWSSPVDVVCAELALLLQSVQILGVVV